MVGLPRLSQPEAASGDRDEAGSDRQHRFFSFYNQRLAALLIFFSTLLPRCTQLSLSLSLALSLSLSLSVSSHTPLQTVTEISTHLVLTWPPVMAVHNLIFLYDLFVFQSNLLFVIAVHELFLSPSL